jgi:hypothetical protein
MLGDPPQAAPQLFGTSRTLEETLYQGAQIEARASDNESDTLSITNRSQSLSTQALIITGGKVFAWHSQVKHVMRNGLPFGWRRFCSPYVHAPIDLQCVAAEYLSAVFLCQSHSEPALARCSRTGNNDSGVVVCRHVLLSELEIKAYADGQQKECGQYQDSQDLRALPFHIPPHVLKNLPRIPRIPRRFSPRLARFV